MTQTGTTDPNYGVMEGSTKNGDFTRFFLHFCADAEEFSKRCRFPFQRNVIFKTLL